MRGAWLWRAAALLLLPVGVNSAAAKDFKFQSDVQADSLQAGDLAGAATAVVTVDTDGKLTRAATLGDALIDNDITVSNYLPLAGGTLSGALSSSSSISAGIISGTAMQSSGSVYGYYGDANGYSECSHYALISIRNTNDIYGGGLALSKTRSSGGMTRVSNGDVIGYIVFRGHDGSIGTCYGAQIMALVDGETGSGSGDVPTRLEFRTRPDGSIPTIGGDALRMTIKNNGDVKVHSGDLSVLSGVVSITESDLINCNPGLTVQTASVPAAIVVENTTTTQHACGMKITCGPTAPTSVNPAVPFMFYKNDGNDTLMGWVNARSDFIGFAWVSDERLKEDIEPTQLDAKSIIKNIDVIDYRYNQAMNSNGELVAIESDTSEEEKPVTGFSAQNLLEVYPQAVSPMPVKPSDESSTDTVIRSTTTEETYYGVTPTALIPVLVKQAQEQQAQIDAQQVEIDELKTKCARVDELEAQLAALTKTVEALASR